MTLPLYATTASLRPRGRFGSKGEGIEPDARGLALEGALVGIGDNFK
jgi:hypothetical protein